MATVSIIMGVFNCQKNINGFYHSIDSIMNQSYTDWELIICNDGSTDNTLEILENLKNKDSRIKIISYDVNKGLANALNYCLENSSGLYIARQDDGGDFSLSSRLQKEIEFLEVNKEYGFVGTNHIEKDISGINRKLHLPKFVTKEDFLWNSPFSHPTCLFRKEVLVNIGGYRVSNETKRCEDYDLFMRLYAKGTIGYNIQEFLYEYVTSYGTGVKHRSFRDRLNEAIVRYKGFKTMNILSYKNCIYIIKPIFVGLLPVKMLIYLKNRFVY